MEASEEDIRAYILALKENTEALGKAGDRKKASARKPDDPTKELGQHFQDLDRTIHSVTNQFSGAIKTITGGADSLVAGFQTLARSIIGGAVVAEIVGAGYDLVKTYRQLADVGQTFSGSMFEMIKQSGEAGLPLGEFTRMLERNSIAAKSLEHQTDGSKMSLGLLSASVRKAAENQSMYGLSVAQLDDLTGDYAEALRLSGRATNANRDVTTKQILSLASDITEFADATGKSRNQIIESMKEVTHTTAFSVASANMNAEQMKAHSTAIASLVALPGGQKLASELEETMAAGGAIYTDFGRKAAEAGVPEIIGIFDEMRQKVLGGHYDKNDAQAVLNQFQAIAKRAGLSMQAFVAQNPAAKELLDTLIPLANTSYEVLQKQQETADKYGKLTGFLLKLENQLNTLGASFAEGFGDALTDLEKTFDVDGKSIFEPLKPILKDLGSRFGGVVKSIITFIANIKQVDVDRVITSLKNFGEGVYLVGSTFASLIDYMATFIGWLKTGYDILDKFFMGFPSKILGFGLVIAGAVVALKLFSGLIRALLSPFRLLSNIWTSARRGPNAGRTGGTTPHEPTGPRGGGRRGGFGALAGNLAADFLGGGGSCCSGLMGGLDALKDVVNLHGNTAAEHAEEHIKATEANKPVENPETAKPATPAEGENVHTTGKPGAGAAAVETAEMGLGSKLIKGTKTVIGSTLKGIASLRGLIPFAIDSAIDNLTPEHWVGKETLKAAAEGAAQGELYGSVAGGVVGGVAGGIGGAGVGAVPGAIAGAGIGGDIGMGLGALYGIASVNWDALTKAISSFGSGEGVAAPSTAETPNATTPAPQMPAPATPSPQQPGAADATMPNQKDQTAAAVDKIAESTREASATSTANNTELLRQVQATNAILSRMLDFSDRHISIDAQNARTQQELMRKQIRTAEAAQASGE